MEKFENDKDDGKYSMKEIAGNLGIIESDYPPIVYLIKDSDDNIVNAYSYDKYALKEVEESFNKNSRIFEWFSCYEKTHIFFVGF